MELGADKDCRQEDECGPDWVTMVGAGGKKENGEAFVRPSLWSV